MQSNGPLPTSFIEASCPSVCISGLENPQVFDLWLQVTWWKPTWIQVFRNWNTCGYGSGSPVSALMLCINLEGWVTCRAKQWPTPTSFIWHGWDVWTDNFWTIGIQGIYSECNKILLGMFDMCELRLNMSALVSNSDLYPWVFHILKVLPRS